ncbi:hypothetical protein KKB40_04735 [Patescibacteria group bacterium]|nr:hypothetical protein [Patescibacteria group bacterium]
MSITLKNNAYHLIGLDTTASQRDILKRSKEIIKRLGIDDLPEYNLDVGLFNDFRTEEATKEAIQKLQTPKKRIKEYFFWLQIADNIDKQAFGLLKLKDFENALRVWENVAEDGGTKYYFYKKNLAILYCLLLSIDDNKNYLRESLAIWKKLVESDKFWIAFSKTYNLHDEQTASQELITDFKNQVVSYLADIYTELYQTHKNTNYIIQFQNVFSAKGERIEKDVLGPAYQAINNVVEELEKMNISEDGVVDKDETQKIKKLIGIIQSELNKLIDFGLYDDSQTKVMRDRAANALKTITLDLHNNLSETDKAIALLNIALKFVGTSGLETKIKQDIKTLEEIKQNTNLVKPILDLIANGQYEKAWAIIKVDREKYHELRGFYNNQTKFCISAIALQKYNKARDYLNGKQENLAKPLFIEAGQLVYDNIALYNFNKKTIDEILVEVKNNAGNINSRNINQFDEYRNSFVKLAKEKFEGEFEETILVILIDSYLFSGLTDLMKKIRHKSGVVSMLYTLGWFTIWFYGIGLIFFIVGWIYKNRD